MGSSRGEASGALWVPIFFPMAETRDIGTKSPKWRKRRSHKYLCLSFPLISLPPFLPSAVTNDSPIQALWRGHRREPQTQALPSGSLGPRTQLDNRMGGRPSGKGNRHPTCTWARQGLKGSVNYRENAEGEEECSRARKPRPQRSGVRWGAGEAGEAQFWDTQASSRQGKGGAGGQGMFPQAGASEWPRQPPAWAPAGPGRRRQRLGEGGRCGWAGENPGAAGKDGDSR